MRARFGDYTPVWEIHNATLSHMLYYDNLCLAFEDEPAGASLGFQPVFTGCSQELYKNTIICDIYALANSVEQPGNSDLLTCSCGYAGHVAIYEGIFISHPDADTIVWEMGTKDYSVFFEGCPEQNGFIRLLFERTAYEHAVRRMFEAAIEQAKAPITAAEYDLHAPVAHYAEALAPPWLTGPIFIDTLLPSEDYVHERCPDRLAEAWLPRPLLPQNTTIEIGISDKGILFYIDGKQHPLYELYKLCTRWTVHQALTALSHARDNIDGAVEECHQCGRHFAELLTQSLHEGNTAPGVRVTYVGTKLQETKST